MDTHPNDGLSRRQFLQTTGALAGAAATGVLSGCLSPSKSPPLGAPQRLAIFIDPADSIPAAPQAQWAITRFREALSRRGIESQINDKAPDTAITIAGISSLPAQQVLAKTSVKAPTSPESLIIL